MATSIAGSVTANGVAQELAVRSYRRYSGALDASSTSTGGSYTNTLTNTLEADTYVAQSGNYRPLVHASSTYEYDEYYNNVMLLLPMTGANNSTTFTDISQNALTVTPSGNTKISTGASKYYGVSAYFDGNRDYLSIAASSMLKFGREDFTVEMWFNQTSKIDAYPRLINFSNGWNSSDSWLVDCNDNDFANKVGFKAYGIATNTNICTSTTSIVSGNWYHVALTRASGVFRLFINGSLESTNSNYITSSIDSSSTNTCIIGSIVTEISGEDFNGYIQDVRITKGVARYTNTFTPPTGLLNHVPKPPFLPVDDPYWANTVLLLPFDGVDGQTAIYDHSGTPKTITVAGNAHIEIDKSKFDYACCAFDGTDDYLTAADSADWDFGTGDFTVELWVNFSATPSSSVYQLLGNYQNATTGWSLQYRTDSSNRLAFSYGDTVLANGASWLPTTGVWYHIAVARSGTNLRLFIDGTQSGDTVTDSTDITGSTAVLAIGCLYNGSSYIYDFNGYMDNLRVTKGVARYTTTFTPPTYSFLDTIPQSTTFTEDTNYASVSLLLPFYGYSGQVNIKDWSSYGKTITVNGNAQISCAQSKYGRSSCWFDGTGDYLTTTLESAIGTGNFTMEAWIFIENKSAQRNFFSVGGAGVGPTLYCTTTSAVKFWLSTDRITGTTVPSVGTWYHVAFCRSGSDNKLFINGTQEGSTWTDSTNITNTAITVSQNTPYAHYGYVQDFRITKAALYTDTFTPPGPLLNTVPTVRGSVVNVATPVQTVVRAVRNDTGAYLNQAFTKSDGSYILPVPYTGAVDVLAYPPSGYRPLAHTTT